MKILGKYKILRGHCPLMGTSEEYNGEVEISQNGVNYLVSWNLKGKKYQGTAIHANNILSIGYDLDSYKYGVGSFTFDYNFKFVKGHYTIKGGIEQGYEYWEKI